MSDYISTLRYLNYELVKELGLFKRRAGLSFAQRHILFHIKNNEKLSIQELAKLIHVDPSTMSRNVKKLIYDGLVESFIDEGDKRRKVIMLTAKGMERLNEATASINQMLIYSLESMSSDEINLIIDGVKKYCEALNNYNQY